MFQSTLSVKMDEVNSSIAHWFMLEQIWRCSLCLAPPFLFAARPVQIRSADCCFSHCSDPRGLAISEIPAGRIRGLDIIWRLKWLSIYRGSWHFLNRARDCLDHLPLRQHFKVLPISFSLNLLVTAIITSESICHPQTVISIHLLFKASSTIFGGRNILYLVKGKKDEWQNWVDLCKRLTAGGDSSKCSG